MAARSAHRLTKDEEYDYDQYGFYLPVSKIKLQNDKLSLKKVNARVEKWRKMLPNIAHLISSSNKKLKERIRKGIPDGIRVKVWPHLAQIETFKKKYSFTELANSQNFPYQTDIEVDLNRTFPNHQLFQNKNNSSGLKALNLVLKAVSLAHAEMGYCQGLNFIAAAFMIYLNDEEAFFLIISLLDNYDCEKMYVDVASIRKQLYVHDHLLKKFMPEITEHLAKFSIETITFATGWYMTLFSSVLPFKYFLRIMDIFFLEKWKIIYRVALAMLKLKKHRLLAAKNFEDIFVVLKDFSEYENSTIDEDKFFKSACNDFSFSKKLIVDLERQYEQANPPQPKRQIVNRPIDDRQSEPEIDDNNKEQSNTNNESEKQNIQGNIDKNNHNGIDKNDANNQQNHKSNQTIVNGNIVQSGQEIIFDSEQPSKSIIEQSQNTTNAHNTEKIIDSSAVVASPISQMHFEKKENQKFEDIKKNQANIKNQVSIDSTCNLSPSFSNENKTAIKMNFQKTLNTIQSKSEYDQSSETTDQPQTNGLHINLQKIQAE